MSARLNHVSNSSDWSAFGEQSSSNARHDNSEIEPDESVVMFPMNNVGSFVLDRKRLIDKILSLIKSQRDDFGSLRTCQSVYMNGCKGMGKTINLMLLSKALKEQGYEVHYFEHAAFIPKFIYKDLESLAKNSSRRVAVITDEIAGKFDISALSTILRLPLKNLVVIGAAIPPVVEPNISGKFLSKINISDLALRETDEDFIRLVDALSGDDPALAKDICFHILKYCGGHVLPTLSLIEFFLSKRRKQFNTMDKFLDYFYCSEFPKTEEFQMIKERCFVLTGANLERVSKVLGGVETTEDIIAVQHVGWWNSDDNCFISVLIKNLCLDSILPDSEEEKILLVFFDFSLSIFWIPPIN
jgi:hypothetical protein